MALGLEPRAFSCAGQAFYHCAASPATSISLNSDVEAFHYCSKLAGSLPEIQCTLLKEHQGNTKEKITRSQSLLEICSHFPCII